MAFNFKTEEFTDDNPDQLKEYGKFEIDFRGDVAVNVFIDGDSAITFNLSSTGARDQKEQNIFINGKRFYIEFSDVSGAEGYIYSWRLGRIPIVCGSDQSSNIFTFRTLEDSLKTPLTNKQFREISIEFKGGTDNSVADGLVASFATSAYDALSTGISGITIGTNGNLFICDETTDLIYEVTMAGVLVNSFPTSTYDVNAISPEWITTALDGTLYIGDKVTKKIYNIKTDGTLISSILYSTFGQTALWGGMAADPDGTLWVGGRTGLASYPSILHITTSGGLLDSFVNTLFGTSADVEGLTVLSDGTLQVIIDVDDKIYRIRRTGQMISSVTRSSYISGLFQGSGMDIAGDATTWIADVLNNKIYNISIGGMPFTIDFFFGGTKRYTKVLGQAQRKTKPFRLPPSCRGNNYHIEFKGDATSPVSVYSYGVTGIAELPNL